MIITADNQTTNAKALQQAGAAQLIGTPEAIDTVLPAAINHLSAHPEELLQMGQRASLITDGLGVQNIFTKLESIYGTE